MSVTSLTSSDAARRGFNAISVRNLSKQYRLGVNRHARFQYHTLRETLVDAAAARLRSIPRLGKHRRPDPTIWALEDVSFDIPPGEVVGVIGRNGAGKSTLLKVLSRITEPTRGRVEIRGRVSSLLEVGTGFHPELTGRDNIYLNGAILGMTRREIQSRFDEIVAFAELPEFVDTPVKRYSSGMYLRLAFAVAAHLEPEILLVDEVLAVGDVVFQKKCLRKMNAVAGEGRTVLLVSHNMEAVRTLAQRVLVLDRGHLLFFGSASDAMVTYFRTIAQASTPGDLSTDPGVLIEGYRRPRSPGQPTTVVSIGVNDMAGEVAVEMLEDLTITLRVTAEKDIETAVAVIAICNEGGQIVTRLFSSDTRPSLSLRRGTNLLQCRIPASPLAPGRYTLDVAVSAGPHTTAWDLIQGYPGFSVFIGGKAERLGWPDRKWGAVLVPDVTWEVGDEK